MLIMLLSFIVKAENLVQFTGGNYIFAENGRLIFNLDSSIFEGRTWKYDSKTDAFYSSFKTNMPIKTLYTDTFMGYEVKLKNSFYYASFNNKNDINQRYQFTKVYQQKAFLPALGWVARVGGMVARNVLPPVIKKCLTNKYCASSVGSGAVNAAFLCAVAYDIGHNNILGSMLPAGVCEKAKSKGFVQNADGVFERETKYSIVCIGGFCMEDHNNDPWIVGRALTRAEATAKAKSLCSSDNGRETWQGPVSCSAPIVYSGTVFCQCATKNGSRYGSVYDVQESSKPAKESMTYVDISEFMADDLKDDPTPYINSSGLGDEIRKEIQATEAGLLSDSKGSFSAIGYDAYRDPQTGRTVQDLISIDSAKNSWESKPSGKAGAGASGGAGVSNITNNVSINHIDRSDVEDSAPIGRSNKPNGSNGSNGSNSGSSSGDDKKGGCEGRQNTVGCMPIGTLPNDTGMEVPKVGGDAMSINPDLFLPSQGTCPAPIEISFGGSNIKIEYDPLCELALKIRLVVILSGILSASFLIFKGFK